MSLRLYRQPLPAYTKQSRPQDTPSVQGSNADPDAATAVTQQLPQPAQQGDNRSPKQSQRERYLQQEQAKTPTSKMHALVQKKPASECTKQFVQVSANTTYFHGCHAVLCKTLAQTLVVNCLLAVLIAKVASSKHGRT